MSVEDNKQQEAQNQGQGEGQKQGEQNPINFDDPKVQEAIQKVVDAQVAEKTQGLAKKKEELLGEVKEYKGKYREVVDKLGGEDLSKLDELLEKDRRQREAEMTEVERLENSYKKEKQQLVDQWQSSLKEKDEALSKKDAALRKYLIDSQLEAVINEQGGNPRFLKPTLASQLDVIEENGEYKVRVMDDGAPRLKMDGTPMGIEDLVGVFKQDEAWADAFKSSGASGGSATGNKKESAKSTGNKPVSQWSVRDKIAYQKEHGQEAYFELLKGEG